MSATHASVAVVGGSGCFEFLDDTREVEVDTPYGVSGHGRRRGRYGGRVPTPAPEGARLPSAPGHLPREPVVAGVVGVASGAPSCAVGGLRQEVAPGDHVVPDRLVDRTLSLVQSHVETGGTRVVVEGSRLCTRAESQDIASQGWTLLNLTGHPEGVLSRELRMCSAAFVLVADMDTGVQSSAGVGQEEVFATFARSINRLKTSLAGVLVELPEPGARGACSSWGDGLDLTDELPGGAA